MLATPAISARARRLRIAWIVAIAADAIQLALLPLFAPGWLSPADDVLDVVVSVAMVVLLGWHPALLPSALAKLLPGVDLLPTWTAAVGVVTLLRRGEAHSPAPPRGPQPPSGATIVEDDARREPPRTLPPEP